MYKTYTTFRPDTGEIIGWIADHEPPAEPGHMESPTGAPIDGSAFYVDLGAGRVKPRPENPATFGDRRLNSLPVPCQIIVNGTTYECREPSATLEFTYRGKYSVTVRAFPYLDAHFEVST